MTPDDVPDEGEQEVQVDTCEDSDDGRPELLDAWLPARALILALAIPLVAVPAVAYVVVPGEGGARPVLAMLYPSPASRLAACVRLTKLRACVCPLGDRGRSEQPPVLRPASVRGRLLARPG